MVGHEHHWNFVADLIGQLMKPVDGLLAGIVPRVGLARHHDLEGKFLCGCPQAVQL